MRGAHVVVSDTPEMMQLLCMNIEGNKQAFQGSSGTPKANTMPAAFAKI